MEQRSRPARKVAISDHIWDAFEEMAQAMGSDRDGLINQAMFMFARLNGFLEAAPAPAPAPADAPQRPRAEAPMSQIEETPPRREVAEPVLEVVGANEPTPEPIEALPLEEVEDEPQEEGGLHLVAEGGDQKVARDRFVIGRGKHCDFVINSGKVSREHAAITREGEDWYIEDLGSSNGTWFNKQRIQRRKIEDGDEYLICSERIRLVYR